MTVDLKKLRFIKQTGRFIKFYLLLFYCFMYLFYFIFLLFLNIKILERANLTGKSKFQCAFLLILFILLYFL